MNKHMRTVFTGSVGREEQRLIRRREMDDSAVGYTTLKASGALGIDSRPDSGVRICCTLQSRSGYEPLEARSSGDGDGLWEDTVTPGPSLHLPQCPAS